MPSLCAENIPAKTYRWTAEVNVPIFASQAANEAQEIWLNNLLRRYWEAEPFQLPPADLTAADWEMRVTHIVSQPNSRYASVLFTVFVSPPGAAHPMRHLFSPAFDLETGAVLTLHDCFGDPVEAAWIFSDMTPVLLEEYYRNREEGPVPGSEDYFASGWTPGIDNFRTFTLEPEGIRIHFQLYQVLPYVYGTPSIFVPLEALESARPNAAIWDR